MSLNNMLRQLICFICFLVPFASTGATLPGPINCSSIELKTSKIASDAGQAGVKELDDYNDLLREVLTEFLKNQEIPVRLVFDCNLLKGAINVKNLENSFMVVQKDQIKGDGKLNLSSLSVHFLGITKNVMEEIQWLQPKQKTGCFDCFKCFKCGNKPMTFRFGCNYSVHNSIIVTKCAFEKITKK